MIRPAVALVALLGVAGCGGSDDSPTSADTDAGADAPAREYQDDAADAQNGTSTAGDDASKTEDGDPNTKEYRVYADLELALGKGVTWSLDPDHSKEQCVNDRTHGTWTTKADEEKTVLWIDASESIYRTCLDLASYATWDLNVTSPFRGHYRVFLGQPETSRGGAEFSTKCLPAGASGLNCEQTKRLGLKISRAKQ